MKITSCCLRSVLAVGLCLTMITASALATVAAQERGKAELAKKWTAPRTPDGHPDMQGVWTHGTLTPFERPTALGTKAFYTEAEAAEVERQARARRANPATPRPDDVGGDNEAFVDSDYSYLRTRQTSIVVDPPDGRLSFRPEAEKKREFNTTNRDDYETMSPWDRCITRSPMLMLPAGYNNGTRIVQTPGFVMIEVEQIHEARIIPMNGRPHADASITTQRGVVCVIQTADCLPVLLCDEAGKVVGAAHAGWRGLAGGVLENTVGRMRDAGAASVIAWLGPAIGPKNFEVGQDVVDAFAQRNGALRSAFAPIEGRTGKYLADIYALARAVLATAGVTRVYGGGLCTVGDAVRFYSYRRDKVTGRMASLIWLE